MTPVVVLFCFAVGAVLVGVVTYAVRGYQQRNRVKELHGDWWPRFETEFRAYADCWEASRQSRASRKPRSRRDFAS